MPEGGCRGCGGHNGCCARSGARVVVVVLARRFRHRRHADVVQPEKAGVIPKSELEDAAGSRCLDNELQVRPPVERGHVRLIQNGIPIPGHAKLIRDVRTTAGVAAIQPAGKQVRLTRDGRQRLGKGSPESRRDPVRHRISRMDKRAVGDDGGVLGVSR